MDAIMNHLQDEQHESMGESGNGRSYDMQPETPLREYVSILLQGRWIILLTLLIVVGSVAYYTFTTRSVYESSTMVLIDMTDKNGAMPVFDITGTSVANRITNELEIMKSTETVEAVAQALLAKRTVDDRSRALLNIILPEESNPAGDTIASEPLIVERLMNTVEFIPIKESDIIRITARSTNPKEAALIANVFTDVYSSRNMNNSRMRSQAVREFLQSQMQSKRRALDTTENELQHYMRASGVVSLDAEANKVVEQLSQLEAQRDGLEVEKSTRLKNLESYKQELARQEPKAAKAMGESNDSYIKLLQEQLAKLEVQRDITIAQNPGLVDEKIYSEKLNEINGQIKEIKKKLNERTQMFLTSLLPAEPNALGGNASFLAQIKQKIIEQQIDLGGIDARSSALNTVIAEYERKFNQIPQKSIDLARLQRSRLSSEKLYLLVEEKYNEAAIKEKSEFGYVNVIDHAKVSIRQVSPRVAQNMILSILAGLALGVGIVLVRAYAYMHVRTPEDLKRSGFIPLASIGLMNGEIKKVESAVALSTGIHTMDTHLIAHYLPLVPVSESYRHLRTNVQHMQIDMPQRCIVVTSANPKEGKTTTTCNLAISFAQTETRVLLVDADMRHPSVHNIFGIPCTRGINEHLIGTATIDEVVLKNVIPNLDILPCGMTPPNPAEILGSKRMKEFIGQMRKCYDLILFDTSPLLAVTDAAALASEANGVILVAAAGQTQMADLERVSEFLTGIGVKILGIVLNKFNARHAYGRYSSSSHYGYYGYESGYYGKDGSKKKKKKIIA
jgi:capsular exopolysaccharide synthesis family protein